MPVIQNAIVLETAATFLTVSAAQKQKCVLKSTIGEVTLRVQNQPVHTLYSVAQDISQAEGPFEMTTVRLDSQSCIHQALTKTALHT
jgi:hypothetical protein